MIKVIASSTKDTANTIPTFNEILLKIVFNVPLQVVVGGPYETSMKKKKLP